ncbi:MAG TPA: polyprenyl synthetase family protein [Phycisphaerales bacterium]|jgi:geranylgeranyl pyrophosphate synthase|nr:polyprenyl synthetase family protein [Phycisphaerales bacterium]
MPDAQRTLHSATRVADLPESVTAPAKRVDAYIEEALGSLGLPSNLTDAMKYSALGPGKRARPLLCWHSFAAVSPKDDPSASLPAAAAIELIHAFSLVHDDLPGLDNDDLRRGRKTLHRHTSEAMAILAGDCMLTSAFQVLTERVPQLTLQARLLHELAMGTNGMIAGQVYDTLGGFNPGLSDHQKLELIHRNKTGMLIRAACRMGALTALEGRPGAGRFDELGAVSHYAEAIGLMFQIVDDLLDVTQSTEHLGKKAGKDQDAGKLTYPGVIGIEPSRAEVRRLHEASLAALEPLGEAAEPLRQLSTYMAVRTK